MRFWHQSSTDLSSVTKYRENIISHASQVLDPGITVEPHGFPTGARPAGFNEDVMQYPYIKFLSERMVTEAALAAEREGFDAVTIGCNLDIGLKTSRSIVNIPVAGVTESSMHAACMLGAKFAFITISAFLQNYLTATAEEHGLRDRMACALTIDDPYKNDPGKGVQEPDRREKRSIYQLVTEDAAKCEEVFLAACEKAIAKGADVLIPGEGILNEFIFARKLTQCNGIPILDANAALWHCATMMVNLKQKSHIGISRGFSYKKPNDDLMEKIRGFHEGLPFSDVPFS